VGASDASKRRAVKIHVGPSPEREIEEAVRLIGATPSELAEASAVIWMDSSPDEFPRPLPGHIGWVQLASAGVEPWIAGGYLDDQRVWTSASGAYAEAVAEHALMLLLAGVRRLPECLASASWRKDYIESVSGTLRSSTVAIVGCGGIGRSLIPSLHALGASVLAVNRSGAAVAGAAETLPHQRVADVWGRADHVVLAAPATSATRHLVGQAELSQMKPTAWLVNVGRGSLVDTDALVAVLKAGGIAGAALDVTDPEPLPEFHPLWAEPRAIITPHIANPRRLLRAALVRRIEENVSCFLRGDALIGVVNTKAGY
jgi:phosphoglycerate dehydrogenase-like enzyme